MRTKSLHDASSNRHATVGHDFHELQSPRSACLLLLQKLLLLVMHLPLLQNCAPVRHPARHDPAQAEGGHEEEALIGCVIHSVRQSAICLHGAAEGVDKVLIVLDGFNSCGGNLQGQVGQEVSEQHAPNSPAGSTIITLEQGKAISCRLQAVAHATLQATPWLVAGPPAPPAR